MDTTTFLISSSEFPEVLDGMFCPEIEPKLSVYTPWIRSPKDSQPS